MFDCAVVVVVAAAVIVRYLIKYFVLWCLFFSFKNHEFMPKNDTETKATAAMAAAISWKLHGKALIAPAFTLVIFIGWRLCVSMSFSLFGIQVIVVVSCCSCRSSSIISITIYFIFFRSM